MYLCMHVCGCVCVRDREIEILCLNNFSNLVKFYWIFDYTLGSPGEL